MKRIALFLVSLFFVISLPIRVGVGDLSFIKEASAEITGDDSPPPIVEDVDTPGEDEEYDGQEEVEPPPVEFAEPPDVVAVPSGTSYVYKVPDTPRFYFYRGYWCRNHRGV